MAQNIWDVTAVTSLTDSDYFYVGIYDDATPTLNKILVADVFSSIRSSISAINTSLNNYALLSNIPTNVSQLTNDAGYLTTHQSLDGYALTSDIPTNNIQLSNGAHYITADYLTQNHYITSNDLSGVIDDIAIETDDTLQQVGVPADAAAVGEALDNISITLDTDGSGQPVPVSSSDDMDDTSIMYLYLGDEEDYEYGYIYCYINNEWTESLHAYGAASGRATFSESSIELLRTILNAATYSQDQSTNISTLINNLTSEL